MTPNSDWWDRAKLPPQPQPIEIRKRERLCTLRKDQNEATLETRVVHGVGQELIFSLNGHWRRMRVFRPFGPTIADAIVKTMETLEARGWR